jgi:hypothetical protein
MLESDAASLEVLPAAETPLAPSPQIATVERLVTPELRTRDGSAMRTSKGRGDGRTRRP